MKVEARSGNTKTPGDLWSGWVVIEGSWKGPFWRGEIGLPVNRYLQYRLTLNEGKPSARVERVRLSVQVPNVAPVIQDLVVLPFAVESREAFANGQSVDTVAFFNEESRRKFIEGRDTRTQLHRQSDPGLMSVVWKAVDPNEDPVRYDLQIQQAGASKWITLASGLDAMYHTFQTEGWSDGFYRLRLIAGDDPGNPTGTSRQGERISDPFAIDHTPPEIHPTEVSREGGPVRIDFRVTDSLDVVDGLTVRIGGGEAVSLLPEDGLFDQAEEQFQLEAEVEPGTDVIIEARDASGNSAIKALHL